MSELKDTSGQPYTSPDGKPAAHGTPLNGGTHVMQSGTVTPVSK